MSRLLDLTCPLDPDYPGNKGLVAAWVAVPGLAAGLTLFDLLNTGRGNPQHGTLVNGPTWSNGPNGLRAVQFDGVDDYVSVTRSAAMQCTARTTVAFWINVTSFPGAGSVYLANIFSDETASGDTHSAIWRLGSAGNSAYAKRIGVNFFNGTNNDTQNNTDLVAGVWTHVAVVTNGTNCTWYLNGEQDTQSAYTPTPQSTSNAYRFGGSHNQVGSGGVRPLNAAISDLCFYPARALSAAEIRDLHDQSRREWGQSEQYRWLDGVTYSLPSASSPVTVTPTTAALSLTGYAPSIRLPKVVVPSTRALTITTYAPTIRLPKTVTPTTASLTTTGYAPTVRTTRTATPTTKALTTTGYAPTVKTPRTVTPTTKALTLTTYAPAVRLGVKTTPGAASLNTTGYAPTVRTPRAVTPAARALSLTGYAPNVVVPGQVIPSPAALNLTGYPPVVRTPRTVTPGPGSLATTRYAPTVRTPRTVTPGTRSLVLTGFAPTVTVGGSTPTPERVDTGFWGVVDQAASWGVVNDSGGWDVVDETARWKP